MRQCLQPTSNFSGDCGSCINMREHNCLSCNSDISFAGLPTRHNTEKVDSMDMPRFNESRRPPFAFTAKRNNFRYWACLGLLSIALVLVTRRGSSPSWDTSLREIDIIQRDLRVEHDAEVRSQEPVSLLTDNGRTNQVQWDNYSIMLRGQRIFL